MTEQSNAELIAEARAAVERHAPTEPEVLAYRLATALEAAEQRAEEAVSQRNRAYRQRDEEREAKEENVRALNRVTGERDQLAAVVEKVRKADRADSTWGVYGECVSRILREAPTDALREHDAELIEELADELDLALYEDIPHGSAIRFHYEAWLREKARQRREDRA